ncbi:MAG: GNAT family N-acetyltransferase [Candidatus Hodarchaeota archaeon]
MRIRPYKDVADRTVTANIMNQMNCHFNPESPSLINVEVWNSIIEDNDQTELVRDFIIAEDHQGTQIGFAGLLKSSKNSWWSVEICVTPEYISGHLAGKLFDAILKVAKDQSAPELRFTHHESFSGLREKFQSLEIQPIMYSWRLRLDDFKKVPENVLPPSGIVVRKQKGAEDYPEYAAAFNATFHEDLNFQPISEESLRQTDQSLQKCNLISKRVFAVEGKQIVGFIIPSISNNPEQKETGNINWLGVIPSHQHRGIGSVLMSYGIQWLRERGCTIIELNVRADNEDALGLYRKYGFYELQAQSFLIYSIQETYLGTCL